MIEHLTFLLLLLAAQGSNIRLCANKICSEPIYKGVGVEDWHTSTPGFIRVIKGGPIVVFGVEGDNYDAESDGIRGFIPKDKAEISERIVEPTVQFNPFYNPDETGGTPNGSDDSATNPEQEASDGSSPVLSDDKYTEKLEKDRKQFMDEVRLSEAKKSLATENINNGEQTGETDEIKKQNEEEKRVAEEERLKAEAQKKKEDEQNRIVEEQKQTEKDRLKAEEEQRKKDEEQKRFAEERKRIEEDKRIAEEEQLKAEEDQRKRDEEQKRITEEQKRIEEERLKAEEEQRKKEEEQKRIAEEQKRIEEDRLEAEEQRKKEEEQNRIAEERLKTEEERLKAEEEQRKKEEEQRKKEEEEKIIAEEQKRIEEERLKAEEQRKKEEEQKRIADEQKRIEEDRLKAEEEQRQKEEQKRIAEERLKAEEQKRIAEEQKRIEDDQLKAEEQRKKKEQKRIAEEEQRSKEEEEKRIAEEKKRIEEERLKAEEEQSKRDKEQKRISDEQKTIDDERLLAEEQKNNDEQKRLDEEEMITKDNNEIKEEEEKSDPDKQKLNAGNNVLPNTVGNVHENSPNSVEKNEKWLKREEEKRKLAEMRRQAEFIANKAQLQEDYRKRREHLQKEQQTIINHYSLKHCGGVSCEDQTNDDFDDIGDPDDVTVFKNVEEDLQPARSKRNTADTKGSRSSGKPISTERNHQGYCSLPLVSSLCHQLGSDGVAMLAFSLLIPIIVYIALRLTGPAAAKNTDRSSSNKETAQPSSSVTAKTDPKILECLEKQSNSQNALVGHMSDVEAKIDALNTDFTALRDDNKTFQENLAELQKKLAASCEKNVVLERENHELRSEIAEAKRYNSGFEELEKSLKATISQLEQKISSCEKIIETQESTAISTMDQILTLQRQLDITKDEVNNTATLLEEANAEISNLGNEVVALNEKQSVTVDLLEQAQSDTDEWMVRTQVLSLELEESKSQEDDLLLRLKEKDSELEVVRECLVDIQSSSKLDHFDIQSHFSEMINVATVKNQNEQLCIELQETREELQTVIDTKELYEERAVEVEDELDCLRKKAEDDARVKAELETKVDTLSSYFKEREESLHVRLSELQIKCKQLEEENSEANILFYKEELSKLKKQHAESERNLTLQIQTNERKAKDAYSQLRIKDTKLRELTEQMKRLKKGIGNSSRASESGLVPTSSFAEPTRKVRDTTDSVSESSLTSAEDLEKRRLERKMMEDRRDRPPYDFEHGNFPIFDERFLPRLFDEVGMPPYPMDFYRDYPFDRDFHPQMRSNDHSLSRDVLRPPSTHERDRPRSEGPVVPPREHGAKSSQSLNENIPALPARSDVSRPPLQVTKDAPVQYMSTPGMQDSPRPTSPSNYFGYNAPVDSGNDSKFNVGV